MHLSMNRYGAALGITAVLTGFSQPVLAQECEGCSSSPSVSFWSGDWNPSFYAGASFQQSLFEDWGTVSRIDASSYTSRSEDDSDTGFRVSAGMDFLEHFGVELTYADLGEASFTGQSDGSGTFFAPGTQRDAVELDGYALHLIARIPIAKDFSLSGRAGLGLWEASQRTSGMYYDPGMGGAPAPFSTNASESSLRFSWGAGLDYDGLKPVRVVLAYEAATFEAPTTAELFGVSDIRSLSLSLNYFF